MKALLKSLTPPLVYDAARSIRMRFSRPIEYRIGRDLITIPPDHDLPVYQAAHRLYDRFLPVLCSHLSPAGVIVDVGANVGDTVAAIMQTCTNPIVAIEGYLPYFRMLRSNLVKIDPDHRVTSIQALVGTGRQTGALVASHGTAVLSNIGSSKTRALDEVLSNWLDQVVLLKVDTDGFDADVILSGMDMIRASQPMLFWEGGTVDNSLSGKLYEELMIAGYNHFWAFDNFGNLLLSECSVKNLHDLDLYVASQYSHRCTRTFFYIDVLASTDRTAIIAQDAIANYRSKFVEA